MQTWDFNRPPEQRSQPMCLVNEQIQLKIIQCWSRSLPLFISKFRLNFARIITHTKLLNCIIQKKNCFVDYNREKRFRDYQNSLQWTKRCRMCERIKVNWITHSVDENKIKHIRIVLCTFEFDCFFFLTFIGIGVFMSSLYKTRTGKKKK